VELLVIFHVHIFSSRYLYKGSTRYQAVRLQYIFWLLILIEVEVRSKNPSTFYKNYTQTYVRYLVFIREVETSRFSKQKY